MSVTVAMRTAVTALWADGADMPTTDTPLMVDRFIGAAQVQCLAWAPALAAGDPPRDETNDAWVLAVMLQARENASATRRDGDTVNVDGFALRVRPLTDAVKTLLRPPTAVPLVG